MEQASEKTQYFVLASGLAGGIAGVVVDFIVFPIEAIKTQIQASNNKIDFKKMASQNSKYKGFSAQFISAFPFAFLYFFTYEEGKRILRGFPSLNLSVQHMIAAGVAEAIGNIFRSPFEVVKQQQQVGWDKQIKQTIQTIYQLNGIKGFYAGFSTLLMRDIPYSVIQYPLYDKMRQIEQVNKRKRDNLPDDAEVKLSFVESSKCGAVAAAVASFVTTPLDVIKTKLMTQRDGYYKGPLDAFKKTIAEEGGLALFKGVKHRVLPLSFTGTIYFTVYEQARNILSKKLQY